MFPESRLNWLFYWAFCTSVATLVHAISQSAGSCRALHLRKHSSIFASMLFLILFNHGRLATKTAQAQTRCLSRTPFFMILDIKKWPRGSQEPRGTLHYFCLWQLPLPPEFTTELEPRNHTKDAFWWLPAQPHRYVHVHGCYLAIPAPPTAAPTERNPGAAFIISDTCLVVASQWHSEAILHFSFQMVYLHPAAWLLLFCCFFWVLLCLSSITYFVIQCVRCTPVCFRVGCSLHDTQYWVL